MTALGPKQLQMLMSLGSPGFALVVPDKLSLSLQKRGLLTPRFSGSDGFLRITPAGLRVLAEAMERGALEPFLPKSPRELAADAAAGTT
jgi:hypothetical protein